MKAKRLLIALLTCTVLLAGCSDNKEDQVSEYSICIADDGNGIVAVNVGESAAPGVEVTLIATPADGYLFQKWIVMNGDAILSNEKTNHTTFTMPVGDVKIGVEFKLESALKYAIIVTGDDNGTIEASIGDTTVPEAEEGVEVTLMATPAEDYSFIKWVVLNGDVSFSDEKINPVTFTMPVGDVEIRAKFKKKIVPNYTYTITAIGDGNGYASASVNGTFAVNAEEGEEITVTASPFSGYEFLKWTVESGDIILSDEETTPATFIMPAVNVEIKAIFKEEFDVFQEITDPGLLAYCRRFDTNRNGKLSMTEAQAVTRIDLAGEGIFDVTSLAGIEYFTNLDFLDCGRNQLTNLDVSANTKLTQLLCYDIGLISLDLSNNPELTWLNCDNNRLTNLNISANTKLRSFFCNYNRLTSLDVSNNPELIYLGCNNNQLESLDISMNKQLFNLDCSNNLLTDLDVSNNTQLNRFTCNNNQLINLDISNCTQLVKLICNNNIDLSIIYVWRDFDIDNPNNSIVIINKDSHTSFVKK